PPTPRAPARRTNTAWSGPAQAPQHWGAGPSSAERRVGHDPAPQRSRREPRRLAQRSARRGDGDLVEQVEQLAHRTYEVAGGQIGFVQDHLEPVPARPPPGGWREAHMGLTQEVQPVLGLQMIEVVPQPRHAREDVAYPAVLHVRDDALVGLAGLERQGRDAGGQL